MIKVYGLNHSPWTQFLLLTMYDKKIPFKTVGIPPLDHVSKHGITMPSLSSGSESAVGSVDCLKLIDQTNATNVLDDEFQLALEKFFISYPNSRAWTPNRFRFWISWSQMTNARVPFICKLGYALFRPFICAYFFTLLHLTSWAQVRKKRPAYNPLHLEKQLAYWNDMLEKGGATYLGGQSYDYRDLALLGQMQCLLCGLSDFSIPLIKKYKSLLSWMGQMHGHFSDYPRMYSRRIEDSQYLIPERANLLERIFFWIGFSILITFFPLTILAIIILLSRRTKSPHHSGALLAKTKHG